MDTNKINTVQNSYLVEVLEPPDLHARVRLEEAERHPLQDQVEVGDERLDVVVGEDGGEGLEGLEVLLEVGVEHLRHEGLVEVGVGHLGGHSVVARLHGSKNKYHIYP